MMKHFLVATAFLYFSGIAKAEIVPKRTYFIELTGDSRLREALLNKLTTKPCFKLADIEKTSTAEHCYAFVPNSKDVKLNGDDTFLFKIKLSSTPKPNQPRILSIQGFKHDGKRLIRYFNPGKFSIPSEHQLKNGNFDFSESQFIEQASNTIIGLAFK